MCSAWRTVRNHLPGDRRVVRRARKVLLEENNGGLVRIVGVIDEIQLYRHRASPNRHSTAERPQPSRCGTAKNATRRPGTEASGELSMSEPLPSSGQSAVRRIRDLLDFRAHYGRERM